MVTAPALARSKPMVTLPALRMRVAWAPFLTSPSIVPTNASSRFHVPDANVTFAAA